MNSNVFTSASKTLCCLGRRSPCGGFVRADFRVGRGLSMSNNASGLHCHVSTKCMSASNILVASGSACRHLGVGSCVSTSVAG